MGVSAGVAVAVFATWVGVKVAAGSAVGVLVAVAVFSTGDGVNVGAGSAVWVKVGDGGRGVGSDVGVAAAAASVLKTAADRPEASPASDSSTHAAKTSTRATNTHALAARIMTQVYQMVARRMIEARLGAGARSAWAGNLEAITQIPSRSRRSNSVL